MDVAPGGMERADLQHDEVERPESFADRLVFRRQTRVAAEEYGVLLRTDHERGPQGRIAIFQAAPGKVLRRRGGHGEPGTRKPVRFPPVEFNDTFGSYAPLLQVRTDSERRHERHVAPGEFTDGRVVQMVVVIVRDENEVHRRHRAQRNWHGLKALRAGEPGWRRARPPDRISQHAKTVDLE